MVEEAILTYRRYRDKRRRWEAEEAENIKALVEWLPGGKK